MTNAALNIADTKSRIDQVFDKQRTASTHPPPPAPPARLEALQKIDKILMENQDSICAAVNADYCNR